MLVPLIFDFCSSQMIGWFRFWHLIMTSDIKGWGFDHGSKICLWFGWVQLIFGSLNLKSMVIWVGLNPVNGKPIRPRVSDWLRCYITFMFSLLKLLYYHSSLELWSTILKVDFSWLLSDFADALRFVNYNFIYS